MLSHGLEQMRIPEDVGRARLDHKRTRGVDVDLLEQVRHHLGGHLGRLIRIGKRRAIDHLVIAQLFGKQRRRIGFVGSKLSPMPPVVRLQARLHAHGRHIAIATAIGTIARRGQ